jgi:DNA modification methylase
VAIKETCKKDVLGMGIFMGMLSHPADLGYDGHLFDLPELRLHEIVVDKTGYVVRLAETLQDRRAARRNSIDDRVSCAAKIANTNNDVCLVWCDLNSESEMLTKAINNAVEVRGAHSPEYKTKSMLDFAEGNIKTLVSKPSICGFGMNFQKCHKMIFVGLSDSFEQYYQAVRRCWRFGQDKPVDVYLITSEKEGAVVKNIKRKEKEFEEMLKGMISSTQELTKENLKSTERTIEKYITDIQKSDNEAWTLYNGDCVEEIQKVDDNSIHYIIFSPPFSSLYTYSNSERDMGNCKTYNEFESHFNFLATELYRTLMPGRLMSIHCMNLPTTKEHHGVIGVQDFRGDLIRLFQDAGFIYHSEVCIWKDPVTAMQRTKALGLLHKQLKKDSCMSRMGIPDYVVTFRKPGDNPERVTHTDRSFPVDVWQRYASPIWDDINPSDTLQKESAREHEDERHIAPLQLEVIRRCLELWTNPNDIVLSPFAGIGSEGYEAIKMGRRFIGIELKKSYFDQAVLNLKNAEKELAKPSQVALGSFGISIES